MQECQKISQDCKHFQYYLQYIEKTVYSIYIHICEVLFEPCKWFFLQLKLVENGRSRVFRFICYNHFLNYLYYVAIL